VAKRGVLSLMRRRRAERVVNESTLGRGADADDDVARAVHAAPAGALARAFLSMACGTIRLRLDGGKDGCASAEAASGWRPARAPDEVGHLEVRLCLSNAIYAYLGARNSGAPCIGLFGFASNGAARRAQSES
jgi:hypothetical protein